MKRKIFTLLTLLLAVCSGAWAGTAIFSPANMTSQPSGTLESTTAGNVWYGNGTNLATGFIIQITGNKGKALSNQSTVTLNSTSYASFKNSNGAQNTITLPSGSYASSVTFYVTTNGDDDAKLSEFNGSSCSDVVTSHKDGAHPTVITKTLGNKNSFTFTFSTKQVFFVAVVTYDQPVITTQPVSATYQKDEAASALTVAATASTGDLSYQWYSCDDANKTNAAAIGGETSASYTPATSSNGTFYYFCRVTDNKGFTDSDVATITVSGETAPTIYADASATSVFLNAPVTLTATITGVPAPAVQWYSCTDTEKSGAVAIDGATSETYAPSTAATGTYYYYAIATNSAGSATSDVITLTVTPLYTVTYSLGEVTGTEGIVPASVNVESSMTIPSNWLLYKDGYTLTAWNDGSADHAIGSEMSVTANTTLTPVFTVNGANAHLGYNTSTVTWDFQTKNGAPTWALEGAGQTGVQIAQTTVGGSSIDVKLDIDATKGKFNNANQNDWAQTNSGTKLTVPVLNGATVQLYVYQEGSSAVTFGGETGTYESNIYSYTAAADGDLDIVIGDQGYSKYLSVTYPSESAVLNVTANNTEVGLTKEIIESVDYLTATTDSWQTNKTYGGYSGDFVNMSKASRYITVKVTGANLFEVFVQNTSAGRIYSVKVGTADAVEITHGGNGVESSGIFAIADPSVETTITIAGSSGSVYPVKVVFNPAVTGTLPASGIATLASAYALDFENATGVEAYVVSEVTQSSAILTQITDAPAETGIILVGEPGAAYSIPVLETASSSPVSYLVAAVTATDVAADEAYILKDGEFHLVTAASKVPASKAYLPASLVPVDGLARAISLSFGEVTGISKAAAETTAPAVGKFVKNGQLVIEKNGKEFNANGAQVK